MSLHAHVYASLPILAVLIAAAWVAGLRAGRRAAGRDGRDAMHDPLTGLPGRPLFRDRVSHALRAARREGTAPAVLLVDLVDFKQVNESLGHELGDLVLQRPRAGCRRPCARATPSPAWAATSSACSSRGCSRRTR